MKQIENRRDVSLLVNNFYDKIRKDELLGPIFNFHIHEDEWPKHLIKLTDFWETNLFGKTKFRGNPTKKHISVDKQMNYTVEQKHFGKWLQLWFETIDENFEGRIALRAKETARKMAHSQFISIWNNRITEKTKKLET